MPSSVLLQAASLRNTWATLAVMKAPSTASDGRDAALPRTQSTASAPASHVDTSGPSLDVARAKPGAEAVDWVLGDATSLPPLEVDGAFMTANVAQVFLSDAAWSTTLDGIAGALRPLGWLVFETRDPARRGWEEWTPASTRVVVDVAGVGTVESWEEVIDVSGPLVTFRSTTILHRDEVTIETSCTLRFRERCRGGDVAARRRLRPGRGPRRS